MPSLFSNESSRGPLYQYWKERGAEEKTLRDQRVQEAKLRSKGFQPTHPAFGPSSNDSYKHRLTSGPPAYGAESDAGEGSALHAGREELPSYPVSTEAQQSDSAGALDQTPSQSAEEEKARLRQSEDRRQQISHDAAIAQTLAAEEGQWQDHAPEISEEGNGKQPERRKSTVGKIGGWLADAATGYTKKQERW